MIEVSVIVPIYNVEKEIRRCIESLVNQTEENIEIILVNDGSTDNSGNIAKEYAEKYNSKIRYYEKENGGLSDARNYGVKKAQGKYISFVDSDDYVNIKLYKELKEYMNQEYDLVKFKIIKVDEKCKELEKNDSPIFNNKSGEEAYNILYCNDKMTDVAWAYLYKREFFINNKFEYSKGLYHEDFGLTSLIILKAKKVASTDVEGYYYVQTQNSITRGNEKNAYKRNIDLLKHYDNMIEKINEYNISKKSKENIKIYYTNSILLAINNLEGEEKKKYIKEIRNRKITKNIKIRNAKQLFKRIVLSINIELYLKIR